MSFAALRAADLDWIVGPGYSWGGYILGCPQRHASCLCYSARIGPDHTIPEQELNISKKVITVETFYLRLLFLFARLSYYFIAVLRLKKSSTLLLAPVLASTQHSSHRKCYWYIFSQNGYFWNSVWPALSSAICHSRGVPTDWEWWFFVTHGGFQLTF